MVYLSDIFGESDDSIVMKEEKECEEKKYLEVGETRENFGGENCE